jgi:alcohol dehydrogenase (NADP+)
MTTTHNLQKSMNLTAVLELTLMYRLKILGQVSIILFIAQDLFSTSYERYKRYKLLTIAMEKLVDEGLVKHIGVANFPVMLLHDLLSFARIKPVVNQVEVHPYNQQSKLISYCTSRNVAVQAYSPLGMPSYKETGEPSILDDPVLTEIAASRGITVAQLCLQWSLQRGLYVIVKSSKRNHLEENLIVGHKNEFANNPIQLTNEEMGRIASLDRNLRFTRPEDWWNDPIMPVFN